MAWLAVLVGDLDSGLGGVSVSGGLTKKQG